MICSIQAALDAQLLELHEYSSELAVLDSWNHEDELGQQLIEDALSIPSDFDQLPSAYLDATSFPFLSYPETSVAPHGDYSALDLDSDTPSSCDVSRRDDSSTTVPSGTPVSSPLLSTSVRDSHISTSRATSAGLGLEIPAAVFHQCTVCHQSFAPARLQ